MKKITDKFIMASRWVSIHFLTQSASSFIFSISFSITFFSIYFLIFYMSFCHLISFLLSIFLSRSRSTSPSCSLSLSSSPVSLSLSLSLSLSIIYLSQTDCLSTPCQHGGTCKETLDGITCTCPTGFYGPTCANGRYDIHF